LDDLSTGSIYAKYDIRYHSGMLVPAVLMATSHWVWSKFDPQQNPNPSTNYDKTLHN